MKTNVSLLLPVTFVALMSFKSFSAQELALPAQQDAVASSPVRESKWNDLSFNWSNAVSNLKSHVVDVKAGLDLLERDRLITEKLVAGEKVSLPKDYIAPKERKMHLDARLAIIASVSSEIENYMRAKTDKELIADQVFGEPGEFRIVFKGVSRKEAEALLVEAQEMQSKWAKLFQPKTTPVAPH